MNECFWQSIFVNYKSATFNYHIYNSVKDKIQVVHSVNVNENNLFNCLQVSFKEFTDEEWQKWNDNEFGNAFPNINNPLPNQIEENSISFSYSIMSLPTSSLTPLQTSSSSNKSNEENTASVGASDFKHVNAQNEENVKPDIKSAQSLNNFIEKKAGEPLINPLALSSTISTHQSSCTQSPVKYNVLDCFSNIQYDPLKKIPKANIITAKSSIPKLHQYIVKVLTMLENNINDIDNDEPFLLEETIISPHWPK